MEHHFFLNGKSVEIETSKPIEDYLRDMFVSEMRIQAKDILPENLQAFVTRQFEAFVGKIPSNS
ncbi:MAG TPA: hypothetical protein VII44_03770 [Puia sp.]